MVKQNSRAVIFQERKNSSLEKLEQFAGEFPEVKEVWFATDLPLKDKNGLSARIKESGVEKIIIAGESPGGLKSFVSASMKEAGKNPEDLTLVSVNGTMLSDGDLLSVFKAKILCAIKDVPFELASDPPGNPVNKATMVIGGGIAGIQASLEIANAGINVTLVEKTGTIGGHMAMFDKTFPTLDCAACILTPKMVEVGQHPNIELLTYSEVLDLSGEAGDYTVKVLKKTRRVDLATCIGCGDCTEKCPVKVPSEFDAGTAMRKAIYIPFPQAVPNKYILDGDNCTYVQKGKCGVCAKVCPVDCIYLDDKDETIEIKVGNIVVATGFKTFDAKKVERFGYGKYPNVLTSLEFERLLNAAGPTGGKIVFRSRDKKKNWIFEANSDSPGKIALIHCVGSRDENYNPYCSRVCCMYSLKMAHLVKEKLPDAEVSEYYIDMRAFGKGYEEFYERIKKEGIDIIRGRTAKVEEKNGHLVLRSEDIEGMKLIEKEVDMVVLAIGLEPGEDSQKLAKSLSLLTDDVGWFAELDSTNQPVNTVRGGIFVAGVCQGPKDIPDSVAQGSAAAARVIQSVINNKVKKGLSDLSYNDIETKVNELISTEE
jgi:heterodisulfide reductase subunit A